jgi:hypothetical protein
MTTSAPELRIAAAKDVRVTASELRVELVDGRTVVAPLGWYPRLAHGSSAERADWRLIGRGEGIHWPELDEDIAVEDLLLGRPSGESQASLARWLAARSTARKLIV